MQFKTAQGVDVPEIGLGTYKLYGKECKKVVAEALDIGYRHIDTAQMYKNEKEIGDAIQYSNVEREDIFLATKIWHTNLAHDDVLQTVEESLSDLQTPYVDLLMIHWPNKQYSLEKTLEAMLVLRDQGKAMNIGVSNFPLSLTKTVLEELRIPIFANQVEFHPFLEQFDLLDYSYDNDFLITAYSPLAQGKVMENETLQEIGDAYGKSPAQVALRWLIEQENVIAIPKATSREHLESNIDIFDFELDDDHFEAIDSLEKNHRLVNPTFAPDWNS
ncbi:aldo/keto reductase [Rhodohalobacter barkolensis]|uniref:Aldo/keto reductase n=1 Tax=Rhodohalobacter barkolensis TaxID=2053187 RepID=A0A2N0VJL7_9BACT|nr:aldo/keto reductase [Rhodohalobacter barkolensis]PKD44382.1 aldo/keto reductase [Rhodohalobacter barkolensis]